MLLWQKKKKQGIVNKLKFQPIPKGISQKSHRRERRRFHRYDSDGKRIGFKPMQQAPGSDSELLGVLVNSSNGGLCMRQDIRISREQVLRLALPIADQKATVPTLGEVRWVKREVSENERFLVGVRYLL